MVSSVRVSPGAARSRWTMKNGQWSVDISHRSLKHLPWIKTWLPKDRYWMYPTPGSFSKLTSGWFLEELKWFRWKKKRKQPFWQKMMSPRFSIPVCSTGDTQVVIEWILQGWCKHTIYTLHRCAFLFRKESISEETWGDVIFGPQKLPRATKTVRGYPYCFGEGRPEKSMFGKSFRFLFFAILDHLLGRSGLLGTG